MGNTTNICLSCGLCCNGIFVGFVELEKEEIPALNKLMEVVETEYKGIFLQPCTKYCNGCSIYTNRPKQCRNYNCGLLKSVEQNELDFNTALEMVDFVKQKKIVIEEKVVNLQLNLQAPSFYFKMIALKRELDKLKVESTLTKNHASLMTELNELNNHLIKNFDASIF